MSSNLLTAISEKGEELGLSRVGIARIEDLAGGSFFEEWINAGFQGEMAYLEKHIGSRNHLQNVLLGAKSAIMVSLNYNQPVPEVDSRYPKVARYALGRDYHRVLKRKLKVLEKYLIEKIPGCRTRICVDTAPIPERELAHLAGLGWFGKNSCLIDSKMGSWFFIGAILVDQELEPSTPSFGGCGRCRNCIDACPTGAIVQLSGRWTVDSRKCISYLTIEKRGDFTESESQAIGGWTVGCDICQEVCPFNQRRDSQPLRARFTDDSSLQDLFSFPSLIEMAAFTEDQFNLISQGRAWRRCKSDGFRRNVLSNIANSNQAEIDTSRFEETASS